jgi:1-acyl-sn-glycerol-3-phosphate acyltransferase
MLTVFRSFIFQVIYLISVMLYGLLPAFIFMLPSRTQHKVYVSWCWLMMRCAKWICGIRYNIIGLEHIQQSTAPKLILSKHQSTWETLALQSLCFPAATILKKELLNIPFFGWGLRALQPIGIDRSNPKEALKQVKREGIKRLQQGLNVLLFPEGTRMAPGQRGKYARSGPEIALEAGVEIIPVALNAGECWPSGRGLKHAGLITVVFGPPITTQEGNSKELINRVEAWIEHQMTLLPPCRAKA